MESENPYVGCDPWKVQTNSSLLGCCFPRGYLAVSGDILDCHIVGVDVMGICAVEARPY